MTSPCVLCNSFPCACQEVHVVEGRYTFQPSTYPCSYCYKTPCVCSLMDSFKQWEEGSDVAYCIGCSTKPCVCAAAILDCKACSHLLGNHSGCICPAATEEECYCGVCSDCNVWIEVDEGHDDNCADLECDGCLSVEEPRELHDVECPCGSFCEKCSLFGDAVDNWAHRSSKMVCGTCMWFTHKLLPYKAEPGVVSIGRCRKHAPTLNGWPVLYENDWCGDHKLDETKA